MVCRCAHKNPSQDHFTSKRALTQAGVEEALRGFETLPAHLDDLAVGQREGLHQARRLLRQLALLRCSGPELVRKWILECMGLPQV
jgi:hypothetical protein